MPGAVTLTVGVAPASPHLLPPESVLFLSEGAWKQGDRFDAGVPGDLYALGTLLYEALTDGHPFDPKLPTETLMGAILGVRPRRPQEVNPKVPAALGDVAMRLLEKQPQDRYPNAEALLQALWAVGKERRQPEWQASLDRAPTPAVSHQAAHPRSVEAPPPTPAPVPPTQRHTWRRGLVAMSALVGLVLAVWLAHSTLAPLPTKGPLPVPIDSTFRESRLPLRLAAWLCAATSLACTSTPVIPKSEDCSPEARQAMFDVLQLVEVEAYYVVIDVRQPLSEDSDGTYRDGAITGVVEVVSGSDRRLPGGTLLHGRLWAGDDILNSHDYPSVIGRYTEAQLPDGRRLPVCIELGNVDGRVPARPGSRPGEVQMQRIHAIHPVMRWH